MFKITQGKGFMITFENGVTISVQFGVGNYCDHYNHDNFNDSEKLASEGSTTAEIAMWRDHPEPTGERTWIHPDDWNDDVKAQCTPAEVLEMMNWSASQ